jgi:hypothetical protein
MEWFLGETGNSGRNPGFNGRAKRREIFTLPERF